MKRKITLAKQCFLKSIKILILFILVIVIFCVIDLLQKPLTDETNRGMSEKEFLERLRGPVQQDNPNLIKLIGSKFIDRPSSKPYNLSTDQIYQFSKDNFGARDIKKITNLLFSQQRGGFFVEAGALDGEFLSNTLWLEKELGWTGLLVEPNPTSYRKLLAKNRKSWTTNTCLSTKPYPFESTVVDVSASASSKVYVPMVFKGASHLYDVTLGPRFDPFFMMSSEHFFQVQCLPLTSLLLALNQTEVDLLSLDIQGSELQVIETILFDKINVNAVIVEHYAPSHPDAKLVDYFRNRGFKLIFCHGEPDYIFISEKLFARHNFTEITKLNVT